MPAKHLFSQAFDQIPPAVVVYRRLPIADEDRFQHPPVHLGRFAGHNTRLRKWQGWHAVLVVRGKVRTPGCT